MYEFRKISRKDCAAVCGMLKEGGVDVCVDGVDLCPNGRRENK